MLQQMQMLNELGGILSANVSGLAALIRASAIICITVCKVQLSV